METIEYIKHLLFWKQFYTETGINLNQKLHEIELSDCLGSEEMRLIKIDALKQLIKEHDY